jgi:hypothetical protein
MDRCSLLGRSRHFGQYSGAVALNRRHDGIRRSVRNILRLLRPYSASGQPVPRGADWAGRLAEFDAALSSERVRQPAVVCERGLSQRCAFQNWRSVAHWGVHGTGRRNHRPFEVGAFFSNRLTWRTPLGAGAWLRRSSFLLAT